MKCQKQVLRKSLRTHELPNLEERTITREKWGRNTIWAVLGLLAIDRWLRIAMVSVLWLLRSTVNSPHCCISINNFCPEYISHELHISFTSTLFCTNYTKHIGRDLTIPLNIIAYFCVRHLSRKCIDFASSIMISWHLSFFSVMFMEKHIFLVS